MQRTPRWRNWLWRWRPRPIGAVTFGWRSSAPFSWDWRAASWRRNFAAVIEWFASGSRCSIPAALTLLRTKRPAGGGRKVKLQRVRDLLVPVLENPLQAGELHWTGVKIHGYLKEQLGLESVLAPRCATCMSWATICGCRVPGQSARMKKNATPS